MRNEFIKNAIVSNGLHQWEVADALGVHESTLCKKLRYELPDDEKARILKTIEEIGGKHDDE